MDTVTKRRYYKKTPLLFELEPIMLTLKLRACLLASVLFLPPVISLAATLKIATAAPDGTAWMKSMRAAGEQIAARTSDRVKLKFYPGGVMGSADTVIRKMRVGQLQGGAFTGGELAELYPDFNLYSMPFLFADEDEVRFLRSKLDERIAIGLESKGLVLIGISGGGFVYLMSDHRIASKKELAASKVWVPEGDAVSELGFRHCGVAPIPFPLSDVYTALQTGLVDTVLNTTVGAIAFQWHTKVKFVTDVPVAYVVGVMAVDKRSFYRIAATDRAIVKEIIGAVFAELDEINIQDNIGARQALINQGIEFITPSAEQSAEWHQVGVDTLESIRADADFGFEHLEYLVEQLELYRQLGQSVQ